VLGRLLLEDMLLEDLLETRDFIAQEMVTIVQQVAA
jgi:hypothetical protein